MAESVDSNLTLEILKEIRKEQRDHRTLLLQLADSNRRLELSMEGRFSAVDKSLAAIEGRFSAVDKGLAAIEGRFSAVNKSLAAVEGRFSAVDKSLAAMGSRFAAIDRRFAAVDQGLAAINARAGAIEARIGAVDQRIGHLTSDLELMVKSELLGALTNFQNKIEIYVDQRLAEQRE